MLTMSMIITCHLLINHFIIDKFTFKIEIIVISHNLTFF